MYNGIGLSSVRGTATSGHVQGNRSHVHANRRRHVMGRHQTSGRENDGRKIVSAAAKWKGNRDIQLHHNKRQIESDLLALREKLENRNMPDEEVQRIVQETRKQKLEALEAQQLKEAQSPPPVEDSVVEPKDGDQQPGESANDSQRPSRWGPPHGDRVCFNCQKPGHFARECTEPRQRRESRPNRDQRSTNAHVQALQKEHNNQKVADAFGIRRDRHVEGKAFDQEARKEELRLKEMEEEKKAAKLAKEDRKKQRDLIRAARKEKRRQRGRSQKRRKRRSPSRSSSSDSYSSSSSDSSRSSFSSRSSLSSSSRSGSSYSSYDSRSSYSSTRRGRRDKHRKNRSNKDKSEVRSRSLSPARREVEGKRSSHKGRSPSRSLSPAMRRDRRQSDESSRHRREGRGASERDDSPDNRKHPSMENEAKQKFDETTKGQQKNC
mmetsp:Transcript_35317/g.73531  ORF Transcript_35317/g.73531 Transcript_35317/m.73531 type:complete len:436 (-) Transcript_35317:1061-2368(-)